MGLLDNLTQILGGLNSGQAAPPTQAGRPDYQAGAQGGGWTDILGPGLLGGLLGAFLPGKGGMVKAGGATALATMLWNKYKDRIFPPAAGAIGGQALGSSGAGLQNAAGLSPLPESEYSEVDQSKLRLIRAMVYAAKSDGRIDDREKELISQRLSQMDAGSGARELADQILNEEPDPQKVAAGVRQPQEAMTLFLASLAVINMDNFMENNYIDSLAKALGLPDEMKRDIEKGALKQPETSQAASPAPV